MDRLTIDVNVARDYLDPQRPGHASARELFELARSDQVELSTAPQGYRLDVTGGDLAGKLRALFEVEEVPPLPQLAYPSKVTFPGRDLIPGNYVEGLASAWDALAAEWHPHEAKEPPGDADRWHVETHLAQQRDAFLTADRSLRAMCDRLKSEYGFPIVALTVADYLAQRPLRE